MSKITAANRTSRSAAGIRTPDVESPEEALDRATVAALPSETIELMTEDELVRVVRAAELPMVNHDCRILRYLDRGTLLRMAYLARRCCRNQGY
jgi:hypothetical protein